MKLDLKKLYESGTALTVAKKALSHEYAKYEVLDSKLEETHIFIHLKCTDIRGKETWLSQYQVHINDDATLSIGQGFYPKDQVEIQRILSLFDLDDWIEEGKFGEWLEKNQFCEKINEDVFEIPIKYLHYNILRLEIDFNFNRLDAYLLTDDEDMGNDFLVDFPIPTSKRFATMLLKSLGIEKGETVK